MKSKPLNNEFFVGLDIGTNSVGYAVTDNQYNLLKFHGKQAWGVTVFDEASLSDTRRSFRTARRRLDRRQQRVILVQELFAKEISKKDPDFFKRLRGGALFREMEGEPYYLFRDPGFTDRDYYNQYPTIHHLISDLMKNDTPHDVRLVYLACAWLVAHRGHFLSNIDKNNLNSVKDFQAVYQELMDFFKSGAASFVAPWNDPEDIDELGNILKKKTGPASKGKQLASILYPDSKPSKEATEDFPFSRDAIVKLLAGSTCKISALYQNPEYDELGSVSLGMDDDKLNEIAANLGDDYDLIAALRKVYDWSVLVDVLGGFDTISEAKVDVYEQHAKDLSDLKKIIRKYCPEKYNEVFRKVSKTSSNYAAYAYHTEESNAAELKKTDLENFSKYLLSTLKDIEPDPEDALLLESIRDRLDKRTFMPKQKNTDNRVIPMQLYWHELDSILKNAEKYLPFLAEVSDGMTVSDKIRSVFEFRIPYFVGPLNTHSEHAWIERKAGKIYPWNFEEMVDLDASEQNFIQRLTNYCTYIPGAPVLSKDSLRYHQFMVLNEINNIRINGTKISVELKQKVYNELFLKNKKVSRKKLEDFLICEGALDREQKEALSGIDIQINADLAPQIAFRRLLENGIITENEAEMIIERSSYSEDKRRLSNWLLKTFPKINEDDRRYICSLKIKDFGRLSKEFLCDLEGVDPETGEIVSILNALWNSNYNLMELISESNPYGFAAALNEVREAYYSENKKSLDERMNEMYLSNAVKRPVYRSLAILKDIEKAFGTPKRIFIEMARGGTEDQRGQRTKSRKQQILDLYAQCRDEDVRVLRQQLEDMGDYADNRLQSDRLFLYYMQLGKSMYSGKAIELEQLGTKLYDIDHIYPQSKVKDDSILNNKVLVLSSENGAKGDKYPVDADIRKDMTGFWTFLKNSGLITEEKYKRLIRNTSFSEEELEGFVSRQMTETAQTTKAVATLLKEKFPDTEIVYPKAKLTSDFRHDFDILKARTYNDLHHAVDAYLNIVTGNVYHMKFTRGWYLKTNGNYTLNTKALFGNPIVVNDEVVWSGAGMLQKVIATARRNTAQFTKYAFFKRGGLFDQMPVHAAEGLTPLKQGLPTEKYGGYNKAGAMFYIPVRYKAGKKTEVFIMSVELLYGEKFLKDPDFAKTYSFERLQKILGKPVDEISFPMGMRPWKVNTMLSLDGFRGCITGIGGGGRTLLFQPLIQFSDSYEWQFYHKKLEEFVRKNKENKSYVYDPHYDKVDKERNLQYYDLHLFKMGNTIYSKRINLPLEIVKEGREKFISLTVQEQAEALLHIHEVFGRTAGGCDLRLIGGAEHAAAMVNFSAAVSNWKKSYKDVRLIDASVSGLWEKTSDNILDLL